MQVERRHPVGRKVWNVLTLLAIVLWAVTIIGSHGSLFSWILSPMDLGPDGWKLWVVPLVAVAILIAAMVIRGAKMEPILMVKIIGVLWLLHAAALGILRANEMGGGMDALALLLVAGFPLVSAGVAVLMVRRKKVAYTGQLVAAALFGIAAALALPYAALVLGCALSGKCI